MTLESQIQFPFSALQGHQDLQTALLLTAIDPLIGGLLIEGPRGTAKSTAARGLADLLVNGKLVNLPLTTTEDQLVGSLNIESVLQHGEVTFKPGLLHQAHQGVLYVDEVNLLPDHLVDALLDVSTSGVNRVERDGVSHQHKAQFVLVGTMNPEEGQLRPQLLDRFGLYVQLPSSIEPEIRQRIVQARLAFDSDPVTFSAGFSTQQQILQQRLNQARVDLQTIPFGEVMLTLVAEKCFQANVEGVRADLTLLRAARAHAAWHQCTEITPADIEAVQHWVLAHRERPPGDGVSPPTQAQGQDPQNLPSNFDSHQDWGAMPPQTPDIVGIKDLKPLPTKK